MYGMKYKFVLLLLVLLAVGLTSAYAGNSQRIGTAGAQELVIPIGSRGTAMGGAVVGNTYGVEAVFWNPAGLASLEASEAMFTHLPYLADINVNFGGVATKIEDFGSLAFAAKVVSIGDMEETTKEFPNGTGRVFNPSFLVAGVTYARELTANTSFGFTANLISETIFEASASGFSFDVGFIYKPRWHGLAIGLVIKNYGPTMAFTGSGLNSVDEAGHQVAAESKAFDLPTSINMGISYDILDDGPNYLMASTNFRANNYSEDLWQGGMEYVYNDMFAVRGGYNYSEQEDYIYGVSLGAGLTYPLGDSKITFDYSWTDTEVFDANQYFTFKVTF